MYVGEPIFCDHIVWAMSHHQLSHRSKSEAWWSLSESKITAIARSKTDEYSFLCAFHVLQSNLPTIIKRSLLVEYPLDRNAPPQRWFLIQRPVLLFSWTRPYHPSWKSHNFLDTINYEIGLVRNYGHDCFQNKIRFRLYLAQSVVNSASYSEDGTILLAGMVRLYTLMQNNDERLHNLDSTV